MLYNYPANQSDNVDDGLLIGKDFLANSKAMFSHPTTTSGLKVAGFLIKNLNVLDPLKDDNNLGRSVSRGKCFCLPCLLLIGNLLISWKQEEARIFCCCIISAINEVPCEFR